MINDKLQGHFLKLRLGFWNLVFQNKVGFFKTRLLLRYKAQNDARELLGKMAQQ